MPIATSSVVSRSELSESEMEKWNRVPSRYPSPSPTPYESPYGTVRADRLSPPSAHHFHCDERLRSSDDLNSSPSRGFCLMNIGPVTMHAISESTPRRRKAPQSKLPILRPFRFDRFPCLLARGSRL